MLDYISDHILVNVLFRLPFESLIRFRCVSKSWLGLIDSPFLREMYSRRSRLIESNPHPDSKIIALFGSQLYTFDSLVKDGSNAYKAIGKKLRSPPLECFETESRLDVVGSCNGILCLWNVWTHDLALWNPFTGDYSALPSQPPYEFGSCTLEGYGYDHLKDDYKLVKWHGHPAPNFSNWLQRPLRYELCVYSLKQNSWWRTMDAIPFELPESYYFPVDYAFVNGSLHWFVDDWIEHQRVGYIVAFDLGSCEFRKIACDHFTVIPGCTNPSYYQGTLSSLNGCLCLVVYKEVYSNSRRRSIEGCGMDIWMMEDYGVESSWIKLTSIDFPADVGIWKFKPLAFLKKRRKLLLQVGSWDKLVLYDLKKKSFRDVSIRGEESCFASCVCVGSFVSPFPNSI